ncbi:MAG: serine O-acetyltransferase EpsC [Planctomycetota bacterium]|jgi:serine O-acetyltransferase
MGGDNKERGEPERRSFVSAFPYKENLPGVVDTVLKRLERRDTVRHVCQYPLPSEETVIRTLDLLAEVLFPGYFGKKALDQANLPFHIGETMSMAYDLLVQEITRCLMHERHCAGKLNREECEDEGRRQTFRLLEKLPELLATLDDDVRAAFQGDPAATGYDEVIFCYPGFRALMVHRIAHQIHQLGVPWLPRMMGEYAHRITGIDIHPGATIGRHFFIDHGTGVVIGETSEVGENVRMYQGVTLGGYHFKIDEKGGLLRGYKRHPTIEDDVIIYSNASILGPITVGKGAVIGANVILTHPVEPGATVTIEKPRHRIRQRNAASDAD